KPLPLVPQQYWVTAENDLEDHPELLFWTVPVFEGDRGIRPDNANIMFHRGMVKATNLFVDHEYPLLSPYRRAPDGTSVGDIELRWEGPDGLLATFHSQFKNWIERARAKVTGNFLLSPIDLHNLDITSKVHLQGRNFYVERIQVTL